jgi:hypothetical protein
MHAEEVLAPTVEVLVPATQDVHAPYPDKILYFPNIHCVHSHVNVNHFPLRCSQHKSPEPALQVQAELVDVNVP